MDITGEPLSANDAGRIVGRIQKRKRSKARENIIAMEPRLSRGLMANIDVIDATAIESAIYIDTPTAVMSFPCIYLPRIYTLLRSV